MEEEAEGGAVAVAQLQPRPVFVQSMSLLLQLAHLRLHKKVVLTYESSHTRRFWHGRTEAVRSASPQSTAFAKAMDTFASDDRDSKKYLLQQGVFSHL